MRVNDLVVLERLEQVMLDPAAVDSVDRVFEPAQAGHHDADGVRRMQADVLEQLHAGLAGKLLVGEDDVDRPLGQDGSGGFGRIGRDDFELGAEQLGEQIRGWPARHRRPESSNGNRSRADPCGDGDGLYAGCDQVAL